VDVEKPHFACKFVLIIATNVLQKSLKKRKGSCDTLQGNLKNEQDKIRESSER
jgi:hypothetical protein